MSTPPAPGAGGSPPHRLTPEQIRDLFERDVRPDLTASPQEQPTVLFLGGEMGSGKTTARGLVAQQLGLQDAVLIEGDEYFDFHPDYHGLVREFGEISAAMRLCRPDVEALRELTRQYARENRLNVVIIGPLGLPAYVEPYITAFREADYRVELAYMATHPALCELSVVGRHFDGLRDFGVLEILPDRHIVENVRSGVVEMLHIAEERGLADALHVITRQGVAFSKERDARDGWQPQTPIREAFEARRSQPWDQETKAFYVERRVQLESSPRTEWGDRLARTDQAAAPMLWPLQLDAPGQLRLLTDQELRGRAEWLLRAEQTAPPQSAQNVAQRLAEEGAPQHLVERALTSAREDQERSRQQAVRMRQQHAQAVQEIERRSQLSPAQRQAEDAVRRRLQAALATARAATPPPKSMQPRIEGSRHPGQGTSL
ncbi:zeta toxin family protein [Streptomyces marianii]|uniref:UDP-N-acetylglucosamine kinase n=1 Tax=Streptomyces marianii TaxID=1817406 RepID=A0A5R9DV74_9ACTN|nr:zeta toxin family protein [Streptomyces marianii]TLQ38942.1 hypothetical protein FEF34_39665 [Streptomyces marianii]